MADIELRKRKSPFEKFISYTPFGYGYDLFKQSVMQPFGFAETPQLPQRAPIGIEGDVAARQHAQAIQRMINQNLTSNVIPGIQREFYGANRFSGQMNRAIGQAQNAGQAAIANAVGESAMQRYLTELGLSEQRDWQQAQLELAGQQGTQQMYGDIGRLLAMIAITYFTGGGEAAALPLIGSLFGKDEDKDDRYGPGY